MTDHTAERTPLLYAPLSERPQLEDMLHSPLTYIEAPTGCGKTSAVQAFLERSGLETLWITLGPGSPETQWEVICRAVEHRFAHRLNAARFMVLKGYPYDERRARETAKIIGGMVPQTPTVVVLDNYQYMNTFETARLTELVLQHNNHDLHLVYLSNNSYRGNGDILRTKGLMTQIDRCCFTLSGEEIGAYFRQSGIELTAGQTAHLEHYTEGLISTLLLSLLHLQKHGTLPRGESVYELMDSLLFEPLEPWMQDWLLSLSLLPDFTEAMARSLSDNPACEAALKEMADKKLFVTYDARRQRYTLQDLARKSLSQRFGLRSTGERSALYTRCADSLERSGMLYEALLFYHRAGAHDRVLEMLERDRGTSISPGRWPTISAVYQSCPLESRKARVGAAMVCAISAYYVGDLERFRQLCEGLDSLPPLPDPAHQALLSGGLEFLHSLGAFNDIAAMSHYHKTAFSLIGSTGALFSEETPSWTLGSPSLLNLFHRESGALEQELRLMHQCLPDYLKLAGGHAAGGAALFEAEARFMQGDTVAASAALEVAVREARAARQSGNLICALYLQAHLELVRGNFPECLELQEQINTIASGTPYHNMLVDMVSLGEAMLYTAIDQPRHIAAWLKNDVLPDNRLPQFAEFTCHIPRGRALLLEGEHALVAEQYSALLNNPRYRPHMLLQIYANLYLAMAFRGLGRDSQALDHLITALDQALPDRLLLPFVENGDELQELLQLLLSNQAYSEFIFHILSQHEHWSSTKKRIAAEFFSGGKSELTPRELEIAELASRGKTNREIAQELSLAHSTIKKSLAVIYGKLGMNSRRALINYLQQEEL